MSELIRTVGMQEAAVEGWGPKKLLSAREYSKEAHGHLQCFCAECLTRGERVKVHYVQGSESKIPFLKLDAQTHEPFGQVIRHYRLSPRYVTTAGGVHICDLPMKQALRDLAYKTNAMPTDQADIYSFNMRVPYGDDYYGRSYEFLDGPFRQERLQVAYGSRRTSPSDSGLKTAEELAKFFTDKSYKPELMREQRLWDGQSIRKAGDILLDDMRAVMRNAFDGARPFAVLFRPIADHRVRARYAKDLRPQNGQWDWVIPGQATQVTHDGASIRPSLVLAFSSQASRAQANKIVTRRRTESGKVPITLAVGLLESHQERFEAAAKAIKSGNGREDGLKQALPIYLRVQDMAQIAEWQEPETQAVFDF